MDHPRAPETRSGHGYLRIGELARRTGTSPELLRAWERRYGLLHPTRSEGGFRLYTADDEARIHRMRDHLGRGVSAAEAAALALAGGRADTGGPSEPSGPAAPSPFRTAAADLAEALDDFAEDRAHAIIDRLLAVYQVEAVLRDVLIPYLHDLGERWADGEVSVAQEHFASNLLRGRLLGLARGWGQGGGPAAVLACLPGEQHELGLLAFGIALHRRGWRVVYLGPDTPIATVRDAAAAVSARLVVLAGTVPERFAVDAEAIADLARHAPVALAGQGASGAVAARTGARHLDQDPVSAAEAVDRGRRA
jgi:DNA-binding transcriptional MerR regulator